MIRKPTDSSAQRRIDFNSVPLENDGIPGMEPAIIQFMIRCHDPEGISNIEAFVRKKLEGQGGKLCAIDIEGIQQNPLNWKKFAVIRVRSKKCDKILDIGKKVELSGNLLSKGRSRNISWERKIGVSEVKQSTAYYGAYLDFGFCSNLGREEEKMIFSVNIA